MPSRINLFSFILELIAAFIVWSFKGFRGKLTDEISGPYDSGKKRDRNIIISLIVILIFIGLISILARNRNEIENKEKNIYKIEIKNNTN